ncbi:serine hydrolase domain-containing protein [Lentzea flava]|uniref:Serine hydrolase n=1 Tax=Lentzea flava TaxID=103732 RepID=A0ABQ2UCY9_9PSEU|nr:serine hydrolase domain-containing protein [Lentzea flava]MCP2197905.1 CubicO group peptidase, beta-lactamase class C family [Lentzea flava]GGU23271.1 serine hydrolase [Lentzea flava]
MNLSELIAKHDVPGAQVAILADGEIRDEAAGVLSTRTQVPATTDSVFKIGSITKIWTATLVQQLVDEGALTLDDPVRDHLPGFRLSDDQATEAVTARHLLTHTSGIAPNHFTDTGCNDDAIAKFVATLADEEHLLPPGTLLSYSNTGFTVLGRLVEVLRGKPFHDVLREQLVAPLGLTTVATIPYEAILHRAAVGHAGTVPTKKWAVSYRTAPSGSHLAMSARDLLTFVRLQLTDFAGLREPQVNDVPDFGDDISGWGLGWMLHPGNVVGHTGVSKGQKAFLRVDPSRGLAVAVLTNSTNGRPLAHEIFTENGIDVAPPPTPPADPAPIDDRMHGTYRNPLYDITLDSTCLTYRPRSDLAASFLGDRTDPVEVVRLGDDTIITTRGHEVMSLIGSDGTGRAKFLHNGGAAYRIA